MYSIDTNIYLDWWVRRYPGDVFPIKLKSWVVVTHETPARTKKNPPRTLYIPDVCGALNIRCIDLLQLMRREKWVFK